MAANPLNSAFCVGDGIGVDSFGRPTWTRTVAGQWSTGFTSRTGISGTGLTVVSNLVARVQNTTSRTRELSLRAQVAYGAFLDYGLAWPQLHWRYAVGANVTEGISTIGSMATQGFNQSYYLRMPGPASGPTYVTLPAGQAIQAALTLLAQASVSGAGFPYQFDAQDGGMFIEAEWLGV